MSFRINQRVQCVAGKNDSGLPVIGLIGRVIAIEQEDFLGIFGDPWRVVFYTLDTSPLCPNGVRMRFSEGTLKAIEDDEQHPNTVIAWSEDCPYRPGREIA